MKKLTILATIAALVCTSVAVNAQTPAARAGAAEKAGKGWPYPEAAQRGATGYSPDYAAFTRVNERWDIYVNIVWRKTGSRTKPDLDYYDYELSQFLETMPSADRATFKGTNQLLLALEQIRTAIIKLPYREPVTGCLLFSVKHDNRSDLAADDCMSRP